MANRDIRNVVLTDNDQDIVEFIKGKKFSPYVKELIRRDMKGQGQNDFTAQALTELLTKLSGGVNKEEDTKDEEAERIEAERLKAEKRRRATSVLSAMKNKSK